MYLKQIDSSGSGLSPSAIAAQLKASLEGRTPKHALLIPPDFTRFYSNAGFITNLYYHMLIEQGCQVAILPALGTHAAMTPGQITTMFGDIPHECFFVHHWRTDVVQIGEVPSSYLSHITDGLWNEPVKAEINRMVMDERYDLILSIGQVVPHEVIGMSNHAKNLLVGVGGSDMIHKSHIIGAVYGMERMMGRDFTPVRKLFDYCMEHFLTARPILFAMTVCTAPNNLTCTHGLFIGDTRAALEGAIALAQKTNIDFVPHGIQKCVVYLDPAEFRSTWLGNKSIYRTRMAIADGGELIVLAPGVCRFGEDDACDALIRTYGYHGRLNVLKQLQDGTHLDLWENLGAAAHLIHGSPDGRFRITYAVKELTKQEITFVGYDWADYDTLCKRYNPATLSTGYNTLPDGETIYYIPNPALGLWIDQERFNETGKKEPL